MADAKGRKTIFITGGGSGIGRAVAQHFAAKGWFVGLADIVEAGMHETAALLPAGASSIHVMDVRHSDQWDRALADFTGQTGGKLHVLFNNAGVADGGELHAMDQSKIDRLIDVNIRGVINGARAGFRYLRDTKDSCLLNTASAAGIYGSPGLSIYCASKFAVRGFTESLDLEYRPYGIKVVDLMPGFIDTPLLDVVSPGSNQNARETVKEIGLEFTPLPEVAQNAWDAVHGKKVHFLVGKTARRTAFFARWAPGLIRRQANQFFGGSTIND